MKFRSFSLKAFILLLSLVLVFSVVSPAAAAKMPAAGRQGAFLAPLHNPGVSMSISPATITAAPGDEFTITVTAAAGASTVDAVQASLDFTPTFLKVLQIIPGGALTTQLQNTFDNSAGTVDYSAGVLPPAAAATGSFTVMQVKFQALAAISGTMITFHSGAPRDSGAFFEGAALTGAGELSGTTVNVSGSAATATPVPTTVPSGSVVMSLVPSVSTVAVNQQFSLAVQVAAGIKQVDSAQASLDFNPSYLRVVSITPGSALGTVLQNTYSNTSGTIDFGAGVLAPAVAPTGTFTVATINFQALALTAGTPITFHSGAPRDSGVFYGGSSLLSSGGLVNATVAVQSYAPTTVYTPGPYNPYYWNIPTFSILGVVMDSNVTVQTYNFPANQTFTVRMGAYGTLGIGGIVVGTFNSGAGGSFQATFNIPDALKGSYQIAIRMDSNYGYYAYNWFYNNTTGATSGFSGIPTFSIVSVQQDSSVTIQTNNFPANQTFTIRMGAYGTLGVGGIVVGTSNSGAGGSFQATYTIPDALKGSYQIAIRMDSNYGYYAFNWFYNNTTGYVTPPVVVPGYYGIPTFAISSVVQNSTVTLVTSNFPPNQHFTVRMGYYGTLGIGGIIVGDMVSGPGGSLQITFNIPAALVGAPQIAIRMDSDSGYYYAYNWFYNNSTY